METSDIEIRTLKLYRTKERFTLCSIGYANSVRKIAHGDIGLEKLHFGTISDKGLPIILNLNWNC